MRCLCHEAGKQLNVFEKEDRHSGAEVTGVPASQQGFVGPWGTGAASSDCPGGADTGKANNPWGRQCPVRAKLLP